MRLKRFVGGLSVALGMLVAPASFAGPFINGSFEDNAYGLTGGCGGGGVCDVTAGFTGWLIGAVGNVDPIKTLWDPSAGNWSIDLNGNRNGDIRQEFSTLAGTQYRVLFDLSGNPEGGPVVKTLQVSAAGDSATFTFDTTGHCKHLTQCSTGMGWTEKEFLFTATSALTTLHFVSLSGNDWYGPALDNVRVSEAPASSVPEPGMIVLLGIGLLGAGALRAARRSGSGPKRVM